MVIILISIFIKIPDTYFDILIQFIYYRYLFNYKNNFTYKSFNYVIKI